MMNQADGESSQRARLSSHLKLIEDLWQKLYYVKWNARSFGMLARLAQDMAQKAQDCKDNRLVGLISQLEHHIKTCVASGSLPQESDRQRLSALLDGLRQALLLKGGRPADEPRTRPLFAPLPEIFVIMADETPSLITKLRDASYRVRHIRSLAEAMEPLMQRAPGAVILDVDVDVEGGPEQALSMVADIRTQNRLRATPIFFLAERNDVAARLEAVKAGGTAYFSKPVDEDDLLSALKEHLLPQTAQGYHRVLIIDDKPTEAWELASTLEEQGITTQVVMQPMQVLQDIYRFRPDLLLLDLDLKEIDGTELAKVVVQHREYDSLPLLLLCFPADLGHYLLELDVPGASLLTKPVPTTYLCWEVKQRLRRARAMRLKLSTLSDNDAVSGLYNRRRFLALLERTLDTLGITHQSLAILFIMLDNLRAIRDSAGVATSDEVVGQAANRLRQALGPEQQAARFSDAIIAVLVPDVQEQPLLKLAQKLREVLESGFYRVGEQALLLRTSIGMALATDRQQDYLTLIQRADAACALARESKSERVFLQQNQRPRDQEPSSRARMLDQVRDIVEHERLWLVFQPIASMHGDATERYEALLRLRNSQGEELLPGSVFGVIQNHQFGQALDRWVIEHALEMLQQRHLVTTLFTKVLPGTLQDRTFSTWLRERLDRAGVDAQRLVFQITEATAERFLRDMFAFLGGIKMLGCGFCLDHFGRGTDSLGLLKNLGADYVKLDMHFVNHLTKDAKKQAQLRELVQNLDSLGAATIIGGIEDVQVLPILWSLGVDLVQGFFLQRPYREMSYDFAGGAF